MKSVMCKNGEHGWCMNRSKEESHCDCDCHVKKRPVEIEFVDHGLTCEHNMPCAVYGGELAVFHMNTGVFQPSRKAQGEGWRTVQAKNKLQKWILGVFFTRKD